MSSEQNEENAPSSISLMNHAGMFLFRIFERLIIWTPLWLVCRAGMLAGWIVYLLFPSRRRIVARNLRIVIDPSLKGRQLTRLVRQNMIRSVMNMLASSKTATMDDESLKKHTTLIGPDVFDDPDTSRHGLICIVSHSGNWEILSRTYIFFPAAKRYGSMYRKMENPLLEQYLYDKRTNNGAHMFSKEGGIHEPIAFLKSGGGLGVLSDQFVQEGLFVPYFGKVTGTTYLPALMQKRTKAKMKPCVSLTVKPGYWACRTSQGLAPEDATGSLAKDTIAVNRLIEEQLSASPLDGFWMHHRWKVSEQFAPSDPKTNAILKGMDLTPFRILFVTPRAFEEAILCVPAVKALKHCRCDMQVNIICPREQQPFWERLDETSHVLSPDSPADLKVRLSSPAIYDEGPYDLAFLLDESPGTVKALNAFQPLVYSGFSSHPLSRLRAFKTVVPATSPGPMKHRIEDYLRILAQHSIPCDDPSYYPARKPGGSSSMTYLSPFSTLGPANEWEEEKWIELANRLDRNQTGILALGEDSTKAKGLAGRLGIQTIHTGDAAALLDHLSNARAVIAVDGLIPSLAAHAGIPSVTLFSTRMPVRYRPLGSFHQSLHRHRACSPCYLKNCDQRTKCVNDLSVDSVWEALAKIQS